MKAKYLPSSDYIYRCKKIPEHGSVVAGPESVPWQLFETVPLVDTVTGLPPLEPTRVSACWDREFLHIRFVCQDPYMISVYTDRDDPLYEQDVIEIFIDELGMGTEYMEIEVSPNNVIFDALIQNDGRGAIVQADLAWNIEGMETEVAVSADSTRVYDIRIPMNAFRRPIEAGDCWRTNFYRIDEQPNGEREYQAWSPTGAVNFHLSQAFGWMEFIM
ncbi:carbohydrate-binding family 9-like protein [Paenibacillus xanthanilyticus]|uniref:Carbohydrate-binding family 9-like protein n=1 Tax=Paenibacillus xanthanilyticus TaxID=1783531 RepID=A0ABV8K7A9_9BACL